MDTHRTGCQLHRPAVPGMDLGIAKPEPEPFPDRLRAARGLARAHADGRQQPGRRFRLHLRWLPLPDPAAGATGRDQGLRAAADTAGIGWPE